MKLQDILGTEQRYDIKAISTDEELTRQIQVILINLTLLDPPADGKFGPKSTAALHRFQTLMECGEPGFLGLKTAKKLIETKREEISSDVLILKITKETILKLRPVASSQLSDAEKQGVKAGQEFKLLAYEPLRGHIRVAFRADEFGEQSVWYVFDQHAEIYQGKDLVCPKPRPQSIKLANFPYRSQLDNYYNPTGSCNVTSIAMCLQYLGVRRRTSGGQFEDELYEYALQKGYSRWSPYDLAKIVKDYGAKDYFAERATMEELQDWLADGKPAVIHGYFTSFGHVMPVVGYDEKGLLVHDPYGEWFSSGYRTDLSGAYLRYSYPLIRRVCMPDGDFWVHFITT
ncbi:C39 family peptidase [Planktothrix sp. FACHB-1365]|uniref:C39 family peptidase n=1 Tax=Planktothrix sp. FACHB-1365 TaxID=2692855 RepID=UPI00168290A0|nr:C39 family peptidase [Planktothrix sp. FACHB-1365]MBD2485171.1 C39 family peptidase [Planktothrix sp. FACHB-1365]